MQMSEVLESLDAEIRSLQRVRALLMESESTEAPVKRGRGRPRKTETPSDAAAPEKPAPRRGRPPRNVSAD